MKIKLFQFEASCIIFFQILSNGGSFLKFIFPLLFITQAITLFVSTGCIVVKYYSITLQYLLWFALMHWHPVEYK